MLSEGGSIHILVLEEFIDSTETQEGEKKVIFKPCGTFKSLLFFKSTVPFQSLGSLVHFCIELTSNLFYEIMHN